MAKADIRIGISGWTYAGWKGKFYPEKLPQRPRLEYREPALQLHRDQRVLLLPPGRPEAPCAVVPSRPGYEKRFHIAQRGAPREASR